MVATRWTLSVDSNVQSSSCRPRTASRIPFNMASNMEGDWHLLEHLAAEKPIVIPGTTRYKRTFPFNVVTGQLVVPQPITSDELLLRDSREQYAGMKLLRGLWQEQAAQSSGTYFPVAVSAGGEAIWCSAGHCLAPALQRQWRGGYCQDVLDATSQTVAREVLDLSWLDSIGATSETAPSLPSRPIHAADQPPDFGFMRTNDAELQPQQIFIPCARQLAAGESVCLMAFANRPTAEWATIYLRTEADWKQERADFQLKHGRELPEHWQLDPAEAFPRVLCLLDDVCFPGRLVASPGSVAAATHRIVEHTCSTFPGMSGAPGVDMREPWKLLFVHYRSDSDWRRNVNYGYSVNHPLFVRAYAREVLPKVLATPSSILRPEMVRCLHEYLTRHNELLEDPALLAAVAQLL